MTGRPWFERKSQNLDKVLQRINKEESNFFILPLFISKNKEKSKFIYKKNNKLDQYQIKKP